MYVYGCDDKSMTILLHVVVLDKRIEELSDSVRQAQTSQIDEFASVGEKTTTQVSFICTSVGEKTTTRVSFIHKSR